MLPITQQKQSHDQHTQPCFKYL